MPELPRNRKAAIPMKIIAIILALALTGCESSEPPSTWGHIRHGQNHLDPGPPL